MKKLPTNIYYETLLNIAHIDTNLQAHLTLLQKTRQKDLKQNGQAFKSLLNTEKCWKENINQVINFLIRQKLYKNIDILLSDPFIQTLDINKDLLIPLKEHLRIDITLEQKEELEIDAQELKNIIKFLVRNNNLTLLKTVLAESSTQALEHTEEELTKYLSLSENPLIQDALRSLVLVKRSESIINVMPQVLEQQPQPENLEQAAPLIQNLEQQPQPTQNEDTTSHNVKQSKSNHFSFFGNISSLNQALKISMTSALAGSAIVGGISLLNPELMATLGSQLMIGVWPALAVAVALIFFASLSYHTMQAKETPSMAMN